MMSHLDNNLNELHDERTEELFIGIHLSTTSFLVNAAPCESGCLSVGWLALRFCSLLWRDSRDGKSAWVVFQVRCVGLQHTITGGGVLLREILFSNKGAVRGCSLFV